MKDVHLPVASIKRISMQNLAPFITERVPGQERCFN